MLACKSLTLFRHALIVASITARVRGCPVSSLAGPLDISALADGAV